MPATGDEAVTLAQLKAAVGEAGGGGEAGTKVLFQGQSEFVILSSDVLPSIDHYRYYAVKNEYEEVAYYRSSDMADGDYAEPFDVQPYWNNNYDWTMYVETYEGMTIFQPGSTGDFGDITMIVGSDQMYPITASSISNSAPTRSRNKPEEDE